MRPQRLGDEWADRMQQSQQCVEDGAEYDLLIRVIVDG